MLQIRAQVRTSSPDLEHNWSIRPAMEDYAFAAAQHAGKVRGDEPTTVGEVLSVHDDVLNVLCILGVESPVDLGLREQQANTLCAYRMSECPMPRRK